MRDEFGSADTPRLTVRDLSAPLFRHSTAMVVTFLVVLTAAALFAWLTPPAYEAEMLLMVRRDRVDPVITADAGARSQRPAADVSESELLSEVELLRSRDILEQVAIDAGLHVPAQFSDATDEAKARATAVRRLRARIEAVPVRRTSMIRVSYQASSAVGAHRVLDRLEKRYLEKHLSVHRSTGTHQFFGQQVERAREELQVAQGRLSEFGRREHVVAPEEEKIATLRQLELFESSLQQARAEAADADRRLTATQQQLAVTPVRQVTAIRTGSNSAVISQLKGRILEMDLQRQDLLAKFNPTYAPVVQLEAQLALARAALERAEQAPILDETTDQNPTHQWLRTEVARIQPERDALAARQAALARTVAEFRQRGLRLDGQTREQQELVQKAKSAQETYVLYTARQEEARIADAMDRTRIANVTVADPPQVPQAPSGNRAMLILWGGLFSALIAGLGVAFALDWLRPGYHSAREVEQSLEIPVLASVSAR